MNMQAYRQRQIVVTGKLQKTSRWQSASINTKITFTDNVLAITLISLKGMSKLFSSFESNPSSLAASLKFLLVATKAFMVVLGTP